MSWRGTSAADQGRPRLLSTGTGLRSSILVGQTKSPRATPTTVREEQTPYPEVRSFNGPSRTGYRRGALLAGETTALVSRSGRPAEWLQAVPAEIRELSCCRGPVSLPAPLARAANSRGRRAELPPLLRSGIRYTLGSLNAHESRLACVWLTIHRRPAIDRTDANHPEAPVLRAFVQQQ